MLEQKSIEKFNSKVKIKMMHLFPSIIFLLLIPFSQESPFFKGFDQKDSSFIKRNILQITNPIKYSESDLLKCDLSLRWVNYKTNNFKCNNDDSVQTANKFIIFQSSTVIGTSHGITI